MDGVGSMDIELSKLEILSKRRQRWTSTISNFSRTLYESKKRRGKRRREGDHGTGAVTPLYFHGGITKNINRPESTWIRDYLRTLMELLIYADETFRWRFGISAVQFNRIHAGLIEKQHNLWGTRTLVPKSMGIPSKLFIVGFHTFVTDRW